MDNAAECIKNVKSVLGDVCEPQTLFASLTDAKKNGEEHKDFNLKMKFSNYENEFTKLKMAFTELETKAKMTDYLTKNSSQDWPTLEHSDDKENMDKVKQDLKKAKREADQVEERLADLIEETQEKIDELQRKKTEVEDALKVVEQKRAKLESLQAAHARAMEGLGTDLQGTNLGSKIQSQREALKNAELAHQKCELVLSEHQRALSGLKSDHCMLAAVNQDCRQLVALFRAQREGHEQRRAERQRWLEQSLQRVREISGVSNIQVKGQTVTLDLVSHGPTSPVKAEMKLLFDCPNDRSKSCRLLSAELGQDVLDFKDVVQEAVSTNDPALLVTEVKHRLTSHAPVLQEVDDLRNHYAIDYMHEERTLRVMLGTSGQIVCTLSIEEGYPARGGVSLTKIEGNGHHRPIEDYKPSTEHPTMSDWLGYLHSQL